MLLKLISGNMPLVVAIGLGEIYSKLEELGLSLMNDERVSKYSEFLKSFQVSS